MKRTNSRRHGVASVLRLENLENRAMLAHAVPVASLTDGFLSVNGTAKADKITLSDQGADILVSVNGRTAMFAADDVDQIYINAGSGNDTVSNNLFVNPPPVNAYLGNGNDIYFGSSGEDVVSGAAGNDSLYGYGDVDYLFGGPGNDNLNGGAGEDYLTGDTGNDYLQGSDGDDQLYGGSGNDYLDGWNGDDFLDGDTGNDTLLGYYGDDYLSGGSGNDYLAGEGGDDFMLGGSGTDTLSGGDGDDFLFVLNAEVGTGKDTVYGGSGDDTVFVADPDALLFTGYISGDVEMIEIL
jgi:Ca2+-binding RTX toxin-like protein